MQLSYVLFKIQGVASPKIGASKMFDFRRITLFCWEKTPLKAQNDYVSQNFWEAMAPFAPPGYAYVKIPIFHNFFRFKILTKDAIHKRLYINQHSYLLQTKKPQHTKTLFYLTFRLMRKPSSGISGNS